jgi:hypothetical protein
MINSHAEFTIKQLDMIEYVRLLGWAQSQLIPRIRANVFEVVRVAETEPNTESENNQG